MSTQMASTERATSLKNKQHILSRRKTMSYTPTSSPSSTVPSGCIPPPRNPYHQNGWVQRKDTECGPSPRKRQRPSLRLRRRPRALQLDGLSPLTRERPSVRLRRRPRALLLDGQSPLERQRPSLRLRRRPRALQLDGPSPLTRQRPSLRLRRRPRALSLDGLSPLARQRPSPRSRRRPERVTLDGPSPGARQRQRGQQQSSLSPTVPIEKIGGAAQQRLLPSTSQQGEQRHEASFLPPLSASLPFESPTATLRRHTAHARIALSRGSATTPRTRTQKRPSA